MPWSTLVSHTMPKTATRMMMPNMHYLHGIFFFPSRYVLCSLVPTREERLLYGWKSLCTCIPGFQKHMLGLSTVRKLWKVICQQVKSYSASCSILTPTIDYWWNSRSTIGWSELAQALYCVLPSCGSRISHITHNCSQAEAQERSQLLSPGDRTSLVSSEVPCNTRVRSTFNTLLSLIVFYRTYASLKARSLPLTAALLPCFLYPEDHIYDPEDISKNVLHGHIMTRVHSKLSPTIITHSPAVSQTHLSRAVYRIRCTRKSSREAG